MRLRNAPLIKGLVLLGGLRGSLDLGVATTADISEGQGGGGLSGGPEQKSKQMSQPAVIQKCVRLSEVGSSLLAGMFEPSVPPGLFTEANRHPEVLILNKI